MPRILGPAMLAIALVGRSLAQTAPTPAVLGFEQHDGHGCVGWAPFGAGYEMDRDQPKEGATSIRCAAPRPDEAHGATFTAELNQTAPRPVVVTGWSRCEGVSGHSDNDYAIYIDITYTDGTPLWGQTAPFAVGSHGWQQRQVTVIPAKPIAQVHVHALFRNHTGTAWFDGFTFNRALTLCYVRRMERGACVWLNDLRESRQVDANADACNVTRTNLGAAGQMSIYPFGAVRCGKRVAALAVPASLGPRVVRFGFNGASRLLYASFDVCLSRKALRSLDPQGRAAASVTALSFDADARWGFRSVVAEYARHDPSAFERRAKAEGLWIPFVPPAKVERSSDFGFAYHEGDDSLESDDRLGVLSFRYTEPMTYWMAMPKAMPRTLEAGLAEVRRQAREAAGEQRLMAQATLNSGCLEADGRPHVDFIDAPWTNGGVWALNPNPALRAPSGELSRAQMAFGDDVLRRIYASGSLDGEYLDSLEGWADVLDYSDRGLAALASPPTFASDSMEPVAPTWFNVAEMTRWLSGRLRSMNKLLMANATPWRIHCFSPWLDVMGTETNWLPGGEWRPDSHAVFSLRRVLSGTKPYLLLQNTDFEKFGRTEVERYIQRCMFYAVFPSMFSVDASSRNYWTQPQWHNRDRDLFVRYMPAIKKLSAAGWRPITGATATPSTVWLERYGADCLAVTNTADAEATGAIRFEGDAWSAAAHDLVSGEVVPAHVVSKVVQLAVKLKAGETRAFRVGPKP
ncbi:MAG: hypothetical protein NT029_14675 [Armatimonadetes bacterium]|nr:hypothetical protein [Armatimonadota bacterium]